VHKPPAGPPSFVAAVHAAASTRPRELRATHPTRAAP